MMPKILFAVAAIALPVPLSFVAKISGVTEAISGIVDKTEKRKVIF
jgi:hypothetical protein